MGKCSIKKITRHIKWLADSTIDLIHFSKVVNKDYCIFISHNGDSAGGAPVVLYELVKSIKDTYKVILLCKKPGGILKQCDENGILAYNMYLLQNLFIRIAIKRNVKFIVTNTIATCDSVKAISKYTEDIPVYWWIHEEKNYLMKYQKKIPTKLLKNIKVLAVSDNVKKDLNTLSKIFSDSVVFFYGCTDLYRESDIRKNHSENDYVISVIGRICNRKNQLQVVRAYNLLDEKIRKSVFLQFVAASKDETYMKQMHELCANNKNISFVGPVDRKDMKDVYAKSNLIICSSIDDPLPVVITEAMMLKCPFITSSCTGQYSLVQDGVNGFSYEVESDEQLVEKITSVMTYSNGDIEKIMNEARKCYLLNFEPAVVKSKFIEMVLND